MAVPNLKSATLVVNPECALLALTSTSMTDIVTAVPTNHSYAVEQIAVTNTGSVSASVTIVINDGGSPATEYELAKNRTVAVKTSVNIALGRAHLLNEGHSIRGLVLTSGMAVAVVVPYTDMIGP